MSYRLNHVHHLDHVVAHQRAKADRFSFLLRSCYNTADINAGTQNLNLRLQQLKLGVVSGSKPVQRQSLEREKETVHTLSFRSARPA